MDYPDRRNTFFAAYENAAVIVAVIRAEELRNPTPCPNCDVAGLVDHLVKAGHRAAALGGRSPRLETSLLMWSCLMLPVSC